MLEENLKKKIFGKYIKTFESDDWKVEYEDEIDDESEKKEQIIKYFDCLFGERLSVIKVLWEGELDEYCQFNGVTKKFVIDTIREYLDKK